MFKLVISDNNADDTTFLLVDDEVTIGRKDTNKLRLAGEMVSRRHARIQHKDNDHWLHDLASYNGVTVNGHLVQEARLLRHGDQIVIGDHAMVYLDDGKPL